MLVQNARVTIYGCIESHDFSRFGKADVAAWNITLYLRDWFAFKFMFLQIYITQIYITEIALHYNTISLPMWQSRRVSSLVAQDALDFTKIKDHFTLTHFTVAGVTARALLLTLGSVNNDQHGTFNISEIVHILPST